MCFAFDAHPPELPADLARPPLAGGAGTEGLVLTAADGARFSAALAASAPDGSPAVLVLPDVRGLYPFYVELAERFAQAGHAALAIDPFGRTAGTGERGADFEYAEHVGQTRASSVQLDLAAAAGALRERAGAQAVVLVGFCFGGSHAFLAAQKPELGLHGVVGFYGVLADRSPQRPSPIARARETRCPVLGLFGGADEHIPPDQIAAYDAALDEAGVEHELVVYPGAPHSFFDRSYREHADACDDAWRRVLGFLAGEER